MTENFRFHSKSFLPQNPLPIRSSKRERAAVRPGEGVKFIAENSGADAR